MIPNKCVSVGELLVIADSSSLKALTLQKPPTAFRLFLVLLSLLETNTRDKHQDLLWTVRIVLTVSSSSRASVSPVVLLKLLVLDEEREMFGLPPPPLLLPSFSLINGLLKRTMESLTDAEYLMLLQKKWHSTISRKKECWCLTSLCWGRSQANLDWIMSLISLPGTAGRSL